MTQREFLNAVINANVSADVTAFAEGRIKHLDDVNANRKSKGTPTQRENAALMETIYQNVEYGKPYTAATLAEQFGITPAKASALAQKFVNAEKATAEKARVEKGKGKVNVYTFTAPEA